MEEKAFMDRSVVKKLCRMTDEWESHHPSCRTCRTEAGATSASNGSFFGLIIPRNTGGKRFSAYAHSQRH